MPVEKFYNEEESSSEEEEDDSSEEDEETTEDGDEEETTDDDDDEEQEETTEDGDENGDEEEEETTDDGDAETEETGDDDDDDDDDDEDSDDEEDEDDSDDSDDDTEDFEDEHDGDDKNSDDPEAPFADDDLAKSTPDDESDRKRKMLAWGLCAAFIILLIVAIGLGVGLSRKEKDPEPTPAPTPVPTMAPLPTAPPVRMPVSLPPRDPDPTTAPTAEPQGNIQESIFISSADTTIYRDGPLAGEAQGGEDTMLVQSGEAGNLDLASAFSLVQFGLNGTTIDLSDESTLALMCLQHLPSTEQGQIATYATCRVAAPADADVESWTLDNAPYVMPDDCEGGMVQFNVSAADELFCIDVTFALNPSTQTESLRGRPKRQLQDLDSFLFMIDAVQLGLGQAGDRFYTSNAADTAQHPTLTITQDGFSGTQTPTIDSETSPPSNVTLGEFDPCFICPEGEVLTLNDAVLAVPAELLPDGLPAEEATCGLVDEICSNGFCDEQVCARLEEFAGTLRPTCGCELEV